MATKDEKIPIHSSEGIPKAQPGRTSKYQWDRLEVNDYLVVQSRKHASYTTTARNYCERRGFDRLFVYRSVRGEHRIYRMK